MSDDQHFRQTLTDAAAEEALMSGLLISGGEAMPEILSPPLEFQDAMLWDERHRLAFQGMHRLHHDHEQIGFVSLNRVLEYKHTDYLMGLIAYNLTSSVYVPHYADQVRRSWKKRGMVDAAKKLVADVAQGEESLNGAIESLSKLRPGAKGREMTASEAIIAMTAQEYGGTPTGFNAIDFVTGGLVPTHLWIVDAFTSVGKTAFALNLAANVLKDDVPVLYFSLEQSIEELIMRLISMRSGVGSRAMRMGGLAYDDQQNVDEAMDYYSRTPLVLFDDLYDIGAIENRVERHAHGGGVVIIDYLQNLRWDDMFKVMSGAAMSAQALAKRAGMTVVAVSQISNTEAQQKDVGQFYSQKGSGAIRDAADKVLRLKRERGSPELTAHLLKHRQGEAGGSFPLFFKLETGRITDVIREELNI